MTLKIRKNGALVDQARAPVRRVGNSWVPVQAIYRREGNAWVPAWIALSLTGSPRATGRYTCTGTKCPTSVVVTASLTGSLSVTGGNGPVSISWSFVSGATFTVNGGNTLSPTFQISIAREGSTNAIYRCSVTDGASTATYDMNVSADYQWSDPR